MRRPWRAGARGHGSFRGLPVCVRPCHGYWSWISAFRLVCVLSSNFFPVIWWKTDGRFSAYRIIYSFYVSYLASEVIYSLKRAGSIGCFWLAFETMFNFIWPMKFNLRHLSLRDWIRSALDYYICLLMLCCYINNIFHC